MNKNQGPTTIELQILEGIVQAGGVVASLFALAVDELGIDYPNAKACVRRLERRGLVVVERHGPGVPLRIRLADELMRFVSGCGPHDMENFSANLSVDISERF